MRALILSEEHDYHGVAVAWGLRELGHEVVWWQRSKFPGSAGLSLILDDQVERITSAEGDLLGAYDAIWFRRGGKPTPDVGLHDADRHVSRLESNATLSAALEMLCARNASALQVNAPAAARRAEAKGFQLSAAMSVGFNVPSTLISNEPAAIRRFYDRHRGQVVTKLQHPFVWRTTSGFPKRLYTSLVSIDDLERDEPLKACPMIYQRRLDFDFELRITCFGRTAFCVRQEHATRTRYGEQVVDIRAEEIAYASFEIPPVLADMCFAYMDRMDLAYAAFDVASVEGVFYFLEANQSGQFLYLESHVPEQRYFDAFCRFLVSGRRDFRYVPGDQPLLRDDFDASEDGRRSYILFERKMRSGEPAPYEVIESS